MKGFIWNPLKISVDKQAMRLLVQYRIRSQKAYYDICDDTGKTMQSGKLSDVKTILDLSALKGKQFVLLIMDGKYINRKNFDLS